ncbi:unnamed protein product [Leptosia nina]|uniref:CHCH domain-containing protein n=1 Tax=Leptosia nina TaxID=320188 RepID=A0AAV1J590_9NEOP
MGLIKNDKIDEDAGLKLLSNMDKQFPGEKDVVSSIRSSCFDGKYEDYEFDDEHCPAMNFYICAYITTLQNCKSWKTTVVCQKMAADMKKCIAQLEDS